MRARASTVDTRYQNTPLARIPLIHLGTPLTQDDPLYHPIDKLCQTEGRLIAELAQPWYGRLTPLKPNDVQAQNPRTATARIVAAIRWSTDNAWLDDDTVIHLLTAPERDQIQRKALSIALEAVEHYYREPGRMNGFSDHHPVRHLLKLLDRQPCPADGIEPRGPRITTERPVVFNP